MYVYFFPAKFTPCAFLIRNPTFIYFELFVTPVRLFSPVRSLISNIYFASLAKNGKRQHYDTYRHVSHHDYLINDSNFLSFDVHKLIYFSLYVY